MNKKIFNNKLRCEATVTAVPHERPPFYYAHDLAQTSKAEHGYDRVVTIVCCSFVTNKQQTIVTDNNNDSDNKQENISKTH